MPSSGSTRRQIDIADALIHAMAWLNRSRVHRAAAGGRHRDQGGRGPGGASRPRCLARRGVLQLPETGWPGSATPGPGAESSRVNSEKLSTCLFLDVFLPPPRVADGPVTGGVDDVDSAKERCHRAVRAAWLSAMAEHSWEITTSPRQARAWSTNRCRRRAQPGSGALGSGRAADPCGVELGVWLSPG